MFANRELVDRLKGEKYVRRQAQKRGVSPLSLSYLGSERGIAVTACGCKRSLFCLPMMASGYSTE